MYTCCPECRTWFRVTTAQLGAARARVRCGQCLESFDASSRLWAEPDESSPRVPWSSDADHPPPAGSTGGGPGPSAEPPHGYVPDESFDTLRAGSSDDPLEDDSFIGSATLHDVDIEVDLDSDAPGPEVGDVRRVSAGAARAHGGADRIHEGRIAARRRRSREQAILNRIEGMDVRRGRRWAGNACIALLLLLFAQYTWFKAGDLAAAFPVLGPALEEFCGVTGCETRRRSRDDGIRVVARTVRPHAEYMSAMSVRATLENRSTQTRPFPVVVFVLYGKDGRTVASRAFEPAEYLEQGFVPPGGLDSGGRVDIAFDLVAPAEVAVSFDLRLI